ncbi:BnaC05g50400D [Brassica napus]|uniref:BnaC05g50400D protein n=1 Tax=Brassica napus TaxID=3708 RepID=A0A078J456_BRANA|nr:BnaC05g50400D [Brassica napus]
MTSSSSSSSISAARRKSESHLFKWEDEAIPDEVRNNKPDKRLPPRLFATDRSPTGRLNIYSKPDILPFIQHVLMNTKELQYIKNSCFGKLFELPARQCHVSCKLIHAFLTRQLLCEDNNTLWTVFRSDPIRFGLQEFGTITGLPCGEFPTDYDTELEVQSNNISDPDWVKLFGKEKIVTIADLRHKLETDARMLGWKKLQLALILIVDSVLIAHQQKTRPTLKYVKMVQSVDAFFQHPWGRESFLKTITCMKPPQECKDPIGELVCLLRQDSFRLKGFPLALQLLAFQAVPQLQTIIHAPVDTLSISQLEEPHLPLHSNINYVDILRVEAEQNVRTSLSLFFKV